MSHKGYNECKYYQCSVRYWLMITPIKCISTTWLWYKVNKIKVKSRQKVSGKKQWYWKKLKMFHMVIREREFGGYFLKVNKSNDIIFSFNNNLLSLFLLPLILSMSNRAFSLRFINLGCHAQLFKCVR